jgi:CubicO group peptidase (beta-lactamase class C family)
MYSTYGITLGGLLVEDVTKTRFEDYLSDNIWKPLKMGRTNINVPATLTPDLAMGYEYLNGQNVPQSWEWYHTTPASSINSSAEDMAHWLIAHLNDGIYQNRNIMSKSMMAEMLKHHQSMHPGMYGVAYGFFEEYYGNLRFLHHGGNMAGFNSLVVLIPEKNAGFFFVSQHENSSFRDYLQWAILIRYYKNNYLHKIPSIADSTTQRTKMFAGKYKQNTYCHSCSTQARTLTFTVTANADGTIQTNGKKWIESKEKLIFIREDGQSKIAFKADSSGKITHMYFGGFWTFEKIE